MSAPASSTPLTAAALVSALGGDPATGMCRCPAHDDKRPSLHVSEGNRGPIWKCFAGCSQEAVMEALRARGLLGPPLKDGARPPRARVMRHDEPDEFEKHRRAWKILRAARMADESPADYLRARGIETVPPCAMVLPAAASKRLTGRRYPAMVLPITDGDLLIGAHITWLSRDGSTKLAVSDGRPRRMYGKAKGGYAQLAEIHPDRPPDALVIGEGAETTLSAMKLSGNPGIAALSADNLAALRPPRAGEYIIAADNDEAGRRAAAALAERLEYEGKQVRVAIPPVENADWNDRLKRGRAVAEEWRAALKRVDVSAESGPISALEEDEFMQLAFAERRLLLQPWLPCPGLAMVYAPKGEGKTWFALAVGKAIAAGYGLLGWQCPDYARVLYVEGELPGQAVQGRLSKFRRSPPGMFHVLCRDTFLLRGEMMPDLGDADGRRELDRIIKQCRPDVIIIDTISTMVRSGVENDAESWAPIQAWLLGHRWQGRTVMLMHHTGKSGQQRGTSKREDVLDTIIALKKQPNECTDTESVFDLTFAKSRDFFGADAEPMRLRFSIEDGQATWTAERMRDVRRERVRDMLDAGMKQKDIARELGVTAGRVSQIVKELKQEENVIEFPKRGDEKKKRDDDGEV